jgi:5-methylcytosine-specific restriction endonuclease McrA
VEEHHLGEGSKLAGSLPEAQHLVDLCVYHGALGFRPDGAFRPQLSSSEYLASIEFLFAAMPASLIGGEYSPAPIKPTIAAHLRNRGSDEPDDVLLACLKSVIEQYQRTRPRSAVWRTRKRGIADIRANTTMYGLIRSRQGHRCATCGICLASGSVDEHLDHVVPFRLIGDVPDGSNWQILCTTCNLGKAEFLMPVLRPSWHNWSYQEGTLAATLEEISNEVRFAAYWDVGACVYCGRSPHETQLTLRKKVETGPAVRTNLEAICLDCR